MGHEIAEAGNPQADLDEKFAEYLDCLDEMQFGVSEEEKKRLREFANTNFSLFMSLYEMVLAAKARGERWIAFDAKSQTAHKDRRIGTDSPSSSGNAWAALVEQFRRGNQDDLVIPPVLQPSYARLLRASEAADIIMGTAPTGIKRIVVFGSTARGQARTDSDIDMAVVHTNQFRGITRIKRNLTGHGFRMGTQGEDMPLNIQLHQAYLYSSDLPPHLRPLNFEAIEEINREGIILREGNNNRPPAS